MTDDSRDALVWGAPVETLLASAGDTRVRLVRDIRDGIPIAEVLSGDDEDIDSLADLIAHRLPGWQVAGDPVLGRALLARGATTERHARTMAIETVHADDSWHTADPGAGLRVVPLDTRTLDPTALLDSQLAAYPVDHPDHEPDTASMLGMLVLIMSGDILGPLMSESMLVVDPDDQVVAGLIINDRDGESPAGGPWVSEVWRHPRHPGLGSVLLKRAIASLRDRGIRYLTLTVTEGNAAAERYARLGFEPVSEAIRVRLPGSGVPADRMTAEAFYWETWHLQAACVTSLPAGIDALRTDEFPGSFAHNCVVARGPRNAPALLAAAERALADAGHRYVEVIGEVHTDTVRAMETAGYEHQQVVVMAAEVASLSALHGRPLDPRVDLADEEELQAWQRAAVRLWQPHASEELVSDLVGRRVLLDRGSRATRLAARIDGVVVGSVDLVARGQVAEVDALVVHPGNRGRRLGEGLMRAAVGQAQASGISVLVLSALTADWPREWYRRLGWTEVSTVHEFMRAAQPPGGEELAG